MIIKFFCLIHILVFQLLLDFVLSQNHIIVVDGYGEEDDENGQIIKYLWVRNSWERWNGNLHFKINFDNACGINLRGGESLVPNFKLNSILK